MPPSPNQLFGSCLTASLEMMVDWLKRENRAKAYSSFRNAAALDGVLTRQGHPNGDQTVHLMWNQATLHNTIYGSAQRLLHLLGSKRSDGGFGLKTRTVSRKKPQSPAPGETVEGVFPGTPSWRDQTPITYWRNTVTGDVRRDNSTAGAPCPLEPIKVWDAGTLARPLLTQPKAEFTPCLLQDPWS